MTVAPEPPILAKMTAAVIAAFLGTGVLRVSPGHPAPVGHRPWSA